ncbi:MAG: cadherin-like domain-containing protein, partial [Desulfobacterales bacterium]|nr:cadherin-like domain-containing protein [Desulfobacterales bacterium]
MAEKNTHNTNPRDKNTSVSKNYEDFSYKQGMETMLREFTNNAFKPSLNSMPTGQTRSAPPAPENLNPGTEDGNYTETSDGFLSSYNEANPSSFRIESPTPGSGASNDSNAGTWTYQSDPGMSEALSFNDVVSNSYFSDSGGSGPTSLSSSGTSATATLNVMAVNDAPVVSGPADLGTMMEDGSILITQNDLLANASDPDGDL